MHTWTRASKKKDDNTGLHTRADLNGPEDQAPRIKNQGSYCSCRCELQELPLLYFFVISFIVKNSTMHATTNILHPGGRRGLFHLL